MICGWCRWEAKESPFCVLLSPLSRMTFLFTPGLLSSALSHLSSLGSPLISCSSWILLLKWLVRDRSELPECFYDPTLWSGAPMPFHWYHVTFCHILSLCLPVISEVILGSSHLLLDTGSVPLSSSNTTGGLLDWALDVHGLCFS